jgi:secondary thiamine-phosphate synthase enzyme
VPFDLSTIHTVPARTIATASLSVETAGEGFFEITRDVACFLAKIKACDGAVLVYLRHTSASLVIQENADPDVRTDLVTALGRMAPADAGWVHKIEGPDDMPAHVKSMLNGVSLQVPVVGGKMTLGTWQVSTSPSIARERTSARWCCSLLVRAKGSEFTLGRPPVGGLASSSCGFRWGADMSDREESRAAKDADRRLFLEKAGRFAAVVPPAVALMLSATGKARAFTTSAATITASVT